MSFIGQNKHCSAKTITYTALFRTEGHWYAGNSPLGEKDLDEWLEIHGRLRAPAAGSSIPVSGWEYKRVGVWTTGDPTLRLTAASLHGNASDLPCCTALTLSAEGEAKETLEGALGRYTRLQGAWSRGRWVSTELNYRLLQIALYPGLWQGP
jgi:hypothetical protein